MRCGKHVKRVACRLSLSSWHASLGSLELNFQLAIGAQVLWSTLNPNPRALGCAGSAVQIWQGGEASAGARGASLASAHELLPALGLPPSTPVSLVKQVRLHAHSSGASGSPEA